jgi:hypothetical protein
MSNPSRGEGKTTQDDWDELCGVLVGGVLLTVEREQPLAAQCRRD